MKIKYTKRLNRKAQKRGYSKEEAVKTVRKIMLSVPPNNLTLGRCGICTRTDSAVFVDIFGYSWRKCIGCGSIFVDNPPTAKSLEAMYKSEEFANMSKQLFNKDTAQFRVREIAQPKYDFVSQYITTNKNTWLDLGCGPGELLYVAQNDGWKVTGFDADPKSQKLGREYFGVDIINRYFSSETAEELDDKYGVVSMLNVLEHCLEPREYVELIASVQDVGDYFVIEVPHFPSLTVYLNASFPETISRILTPPLHLYIFSVLGTIKMLRDFGYVPKACWFYGQDVWELMDTLDLLSGDVISFRSVLEHSEYKLQEVMDLHHFSDFFLMVAEKRGNDSV